MTFAQQMTTIESRVQAACLAVDATFTDVTIGLPVPRGDRCVRIAWSGDAEPVRMPGRFTGNSELLGDAVLVRGFWAVPSMDEAAHRGRVLEMAAVAHAIRSAIYTDNDPDDLDAISMDYADPDLVQIGGSLFAIVDINLVLSYREQEITR